MIHKEEMTKHTFHLFAGDYDRLIELHPGLPGALIIRTLVRKHIESLEAGEVRVPENVKVDI